jgi:hypothetical protein
MYYKSLDEPGVFQIKHAHNEDKCFACDRDLTAPIVQYHGSRAISMHRDCAFAMAQRLIADSWGNRRDGELMKCDR